MSTKVHICYNGQTQQFSSRLHNYKPYLKTSYKRYTEEANNPHNLKMFLRSRNLEILLLVFIVATDVIQMQDLNAPAFHVTTHETTLTTCQPTDDFVSGIISGYRMANDCDGAMAANVPTAQMGRAGGGAGRRMGGAKKPEGGSNPFSSLFGWFLNCN